MPSAVELARMLSSLPPEQRAALLDANRAGFDRLVGLRYDVVEDARVVATLDVGPDHLQPYGLVHGGVYAMMIESVCSVGEALRQLAQGRNVVGVENTTRFLQGARTGSALRAEATALDVEEEHRGCWEATVTDAEGRTCATGRLVLAILPADATVGGEAVSLPDFVTDASD